MAHIDWSNSYSVGIQNMDEQHKKWINIINDLHDSMKAGKSKNILGDIIRQMADYVAVHFSAEEALLIKNGYLELAHHKFLHNAYIDSLKKQHDDFTAGKLAMSVSLMDSLKKWLLNHIMNEDKKYGVYLNSKGIK